MRHRCSTNFLSQWAKPDPLKPFPYSLWTESITQLEAVPVLFVPAFQAQERTIITKQTSLPMPSPSCSAQDTCLRARRICKFRRRCWALLSPNSEGPCSHCAEGKAWLLPPWLWPGTMLPSACLLSHSPAHFPSFPACKRRGLLESWISSQVWFTSWFHVEL